MKKKTKLARYISYNKCHHWTLVCRLSNLKKWNSSDTKCQSSVQSQCSHNTPRLFFFALHFIKMHYLNFILHFCNSLFICASFPVIERSCRQWLTNCYWCISYCATLLCCYVVIRFLKVTTFHIVKKCKFICALCAQIYKKFACLSLCKCVYFCMHFYAHTFTCIQVHEETNPAFANVVYACFLHACTYSMNRHTSSFVV